MSYQEYAKYTKIFKEFYKDSLLLKYFRVRKKTTKDCVVWFTIFMYCISNNSLQVYINA